MQPTEVIFRATTFLAQRIQNLKDSVRRHSKIGELQTEAARALAGP